MQQAKTAPPASELQPAVRKRRRSPIERALVWGVILVLYLVVVFEWRAQYGFTQASTAISAAIEAAEKSKKTVTEADAIRIFKSEPTYREKGRYQISDVWFCTWRWRSLFKSYGIKLTIDEEDGVMLVDFES